MAALDTLKLSNTKRTIASTPEGRLRARLIDAIHIQIEAAEAMSQGQSFARYGERWVVNPETKEKELRKVPLRFMPWWWKTEAGTYFLGVRYGNRYLEIKPKKTAIEAGDAKQLVTVLKTLETAVAAGELDEALVKAMGARKDQFASRKIGGVGKQAS